MLVTKNRCNGQKCTSFIDDVSKWTKMYLYILQGCRKYQINPHLWVARRSGSRLCWRATCQG